jgi:hypothetical protein
MAPSFGGADGATLPTQRLAAQFAVRTLSSAPWQTLEHLRQSGRGEPDHFLGGYVVNLGVAEFLAAALWATLLVATWPDPSWAVMQWLGAALVVVMPVALYPFTRLVFLAVDLNFQPARPGDFGEEDPTCK